MVNEKMFLTTKEAAERLGVRQAYVRELLGRAQYDPAVKLRGTKVGKEWRIDPLSVNAHLGIDRDITYIKSQNRISELEAQNTKLIDDLATVKNLAQTILSLIERNNLLDLL